jgi:hypothetical protein
METQVLSGGIPRQRPFLWPFAPAALLLVMALIALASSSCGIPKDTMRSLAGGYARLSVPSVSVSEAR